MNTLPNNPDVVVVGAGVAGLTAAKALQDAGMDTIVLEAADYVGGRCTTDTTTFSTPFDRGGSWLHSAQINPLVPLVEAKKLKLHKTKWDWTRVHAQGYDLTEPEVSEYSQYQDAMWPLIETAAEQAEDASPIGFLPDGSWRETASKFIAQLQGGDADAVSNRDIANYSNAPGDWLVEGGLGEFIRLIHLNVPVRCKCPVSLIDRSGSLVEVTTPLGKIRARHVIVTVSTGVLASGSIKFTPDLPSDKYTAVNLLPNGLLNKVGIEFVDGWKGAKQGDIADFHTDGDAYCTLHFGFYDTSLATGFVAGRFADELEQQGSGAATAFCLEALRHFFGSDIDRSIARTTETAWRSNPNTRGSYSYARPGGAVSRAILARPEDNKLFFAGEATMTDAYATVHGAYLSGKRAANEILQLSQRGAA